MSMLRAFNTLNAIESGTLNATELESLFSATERLSEFKILLDMPGTARRLTSAPVSVDTVKDSATAAAAVGNSGVAIKALLEEPDNLTTFMKTDTWLSDGNIIRKLLDSVEVEEHLLSLTDIVSTILSGTVAYTTVTALTESKLLVCYQNGSASNHAYAVIINVTESGLTTGTPKVINSVTSTYHTVTALTDTTAIVCYKNTGADISQANVISIAGDVITVGATATINATSAIPMQVAKLTGTSAVVCYKYSTTSCTANVLTVSGTTITVGSPATVDSVSSEYVKVAVLTPTTAIVSYLQTSVSTYPYATKITISGTTITSSTPTALSSVIGNYTSIVRLTDTRALVGFQNGTSAPYSAYVCVVDAGGASVVSGTPVLVEKTTATYLNTVSLTENKVLLVYRSAMTYCRAVILTIEDFNISVDTLKHIINTDSTYISMTKLKGYKCAVVCKNSQGTGTCAIIGA